MTATSSLASTVVLATSCALVDSSTTETSTPGATPAVPPPAAPIPIPTWLKSLAAATRTDCAPLALPVTFWLIRAPWPMVAVVSTSMTLTAAATPTPKVPPMARLNDMDSTSSFDEADTATPRKFAFVAAMAVRSCVMPGSSDMSSLPSLSASLSVTPTPTGVPTSRPSASGFAPPESDRSPSVTPALVLPVVVSMLNLPVRALTASKPSPVTLALVPM